MSFNEIDDLFEFAKECEARPKIDHHRPLGRAGYVSAHWTGDKEIEIMDREDSSIVFAFSAAEIKALYRFRIKVLIADHKRGGKDATNL